MVSQDVRTEVTRAMADLSLDDQRRVIEFAQALNGIPRGISMDELLKFSDGLSVEEAQAMMRTMDEEFEQVEADV